MFSGREEWYNKRAGDSVKKKMKKIRRLITNPYTKKIKMTTLYEYPAKVGTTGSTVIWLLEEAEKGKQIFGFCLEDRYSPYMTGQAFRYAEAQRFLVTDFQNRPSGEFLIISR